MAVGGIDCGIAVEDRLCSRPQGFCFRVFVPEVGALFRVIGRPLLDPPRCSSALGQRWPAGVACSSSRRFARSGSGRSRSICGVPAAPVSWCTCRQQRPSVGWSRRSGNAGGCWCAFGAAGAGWWVGVGVVGFASGGSLGAVRGLSISAQQAAAPVRTRLWVGGRRGRRPSRRVAPTVWLRGGPPVGVVWSTACGR